MSGSLGKSKSKNKSASEFDSTASSLQTANQMSETGALQTGTSAQNVYTGQDPYLQALYQQGLGAVQDPSLTNQATAAASQYAQQQPGQVYDPALASYQQSFGATNPYATATQGLTDPLISGLTNILNTPYQSAQGGSNPLLDANVAMTLEQASQNLQRNVLPDIGRTAQSAGQFGGSRQDIATGLALSDANQQAMQTASQMYGDQYASDRAANLQAEAAWQQNQLAAAQQIQALMGGQVSTAAQAPTVGGELTNLGMAPSSIYGTAAQAQFDPLANYAGILGAPVVLGSASDYGSSYGLSQADMLAQQQAASSGASTASGKSSAFNVGASVMPF